MDFKTELEKVSRDEIAEIGNHDLMDFIKIDLLLKQEFDYPEIIEDLFDEEWDEIDVDLTPIRNRIKEKLTSFSNQELYDFFNRYACKDFVIDELMQFNHEQKQEILEFIKR